jgi:hypothetical protein
MWCAVISVTVHYMWRADISVTAHYMWRAVISVTAHYMWRADISVTAHCITSLHFNKNIISLIAFLNRRLILKNFRFLMTPFLNRFQFFKARVNLLDSK